MSLAKKLNFQTNKYLYFSLVAAIINFILVIVIFGWQIDVDTDSYLASMSDIINRSSAHLVTDLSRVLRPAGMLLAIPFTAFFSNLTSLLLENIIFYFLAVFFIFKIGEQLLKSKKLAFWTIVFYITAFPLLRFGLAALTDMSSWFFYILSIYLTIKFIKKPNLALVYLNGFLSGFAVLIKESGGMGILFFLAALVLSKKFNWSEIFNWSIHFLFIFLLPIFINQMFVYNYFHYTYYDWYLYNTKRYLKSTYEFRHVISNFVTLFGLGWLFFLRGGYELIKRGINENKYLILALLVPSLSFFLWPSLVTRLMYIAGPLLALLAAVGLVKIRDKSKSGTYILLILTIAANYCFVWLVHFKWGL